MTLIRWHRSCWGDDVAVVGWLRPVYLRATATGEWLVAKMRPTWVPRLAWVTGERPWWLPERWWVFPVWWTGKVENRKAARKRAEIKWREIR